MMNFLLLFALAIPAALVVVIVLALRRREHVTSAAPGAGTRGVRRFFQYLLLFALTILAAVGVADLLGRLFGATTSGGETLALPLSFTLVGLPLACLIAWWTRRAMRHDPEEAASLWYAVYLTLATWTALIVAMVALQALLSGALRGDVNGDALARLVVWGALWALHWRLARPLGDMRGWPHLLVGSLIGLGTAAVSMGLLLGTSLGALLLDGPGELVFGTSGELARFGAMFITGALVWVRYWPGAAARLPRSTPWLAYVLPVGVGGGLLTALVAASILLWQVLVWLVGDHLGLNARQHFADSPSALAFTVVGLLIWWYHGAILAETRRNRSEVRRVYEYLVSALGLIAASAGVGMVIVAAIESFTPGVDLGMSVVNTLLGAVTLLAVGVPVWWLFWSRIQRVRADDPVSETASPTRRTYLVLLFGIVGVAAVVALLVAVFVLLQDVIAGTASAETLRSMRYALGVLVTAAAVSAYHGAVFREDRHVALPNRPTGPRSVLLVGAPAPGLALALSRATGARTQVLVRSDGAAPPWSEETLIAALHAHPGEDLLVMGGDPPEVLVLDRERPHHDA
ncbi:DUF5671 domain-containing protein [Tessaracoccus antarcticus]|nr:DUF5671 domain-containing protein [Tessaracoccus antarcticus]